MIASLTKSQEEQSQRQLIHLNTILDQKLQDEQVIIFILEVFI